MDANTQQARTRVKICGLTREQDVQAAVAAGADALGFVFAERSSRFVDIDRARQLLAEVPPFVQSVALFLDPSADWVAKVRDELQLDLLQFHGRESGRFCAGFGRPYIKALGRDLFESGLESALVEHPHARGFLLDSHVSGEVGGTGVAFDLSMWPSRGGRHLILAGGLNPENVGAAVRAVRPYAVDVSSGVEARPGIKDADKMNEFVQRVMHATS